MVHLGQAMGEVIVFLVDCRSCRSDFQSIWFLISLNIEKNDISIKMVLGQDVFCSEEDVLLPIYKLVVFSLGGIGGRQEQ